MRHVTHCSFEMQRAMVEKRSTQSLQKLEPSSILCKRCKPKIVERQVAERVCYALQPTCDLPRTFIATQVARKIAPCNTSLLCSIIGSLQNLQDKLQKLPVTPCNLTATCLATPLQHKLQGKLHSLTGGRGQLAQILCRYVPQRNQKVDP